MYRLSGGQRDGGDNGMSWIRWETKRRREKKGRNNVCGSCTGDNGAFVRVCVFR